MEEHNKACLSLPPVVTSSYEPKGQYLQVGKLRTYVTGKQDAKRGIIDVYDIFGICPQTLQGADRLAESVQAVVFVPDFFEGSPLPLDCVPPDTDSKKAAMEIFRKTKADIPAAVTSLLDTTAAAKTQFPQVSKWAAFGLCWGGKVAVLASADSTPFTASGQTHPGRLAAEDASALTIPHIVLASKDEAAEVVAEYAKIMKQDGKVGMVETYGTMFHGWMGARADLQDEENAREFERGYTQAAEFFASYL